MATPAPRSDRFEAGRVDRSAPTQRDYVNHDKQVGASVRRDQVVACNRLITNKGGTPIWALSLAEVIAAALGLTALLTSVIHAYLLGRSGKRPVAVAKSAGWGTLALLVTYSMIMVVTSPPSAPSSQEAAVGDVFLALPLFVALIVVVGVGMGLQRGVARVKGQSPQRSGSAQAGTRPPSGRHPAVTETAWP